MPTIILEGFVESNSGLENQFSSFKRVILDELATCKSDLFNDMQSLANIDLANGSGQSGSGLTHAGSGQMGSGQKTGHPKWVA